MKPNLYAAMLTLSGLSEKEAAALHDVEVRTVKTWNDGRSKPTAKAMQDIKDVIVAQEQLAMYSLNRITGLVEKQGAPKVVDLGYPVHKAEAEALGLPTLSACMAMVARVAAMIPYEVNLVPQGEATGTPGPSPLGKIN